MRDGRQVQTIPVSGLFRGRFAHRLRRGALHFAMPAHAGRAILLRIPPLNEWPLASIASAAMPAMRSSVVAPGQSSRSRFAKIASIDSS